MNITPLSAEWAKKAYRIASNRYKNGITSYLEVTISEQEELASQITQNNLQGLRFVGTFQLIKGIGGGWWVGM